MTDGGQHTGLFNSHRHKIILAINQKIYGYTQGQFESAQGIFDHQIGLFRVKATADQHLYFFFIETGEFAEKAMKVARAYL